MEGSPPEIAGAGLCCFLSVGLQVPARRGHFDPVDLSLFCRILGNSCILFFSSSLFCFNTPGDPLYSKAFCGLSSKLHSLFSSLSCCFRREMSSSGRSCFTLKEEKLYVPYNSSGKSCIFFLLCTPVFCLYIVCLN